MENGPLTYRVVVFDPAVEVAPRAVREEARRRFDDIASSLDAIPADNPFWVSVRASRLCLVVRGWSFFYTLDRETLRATEVRR